MLSAYLTLLIFLLTILILACASSSPGFHMVYSTYKLNKQDGNIQPWCAPFPIWSQSFVPCPVLTVASSPYTGGRFLRRQVRWSGIPISWRIFHSLLWSTQSKALVNEAVVDIFLEFFFSMIQRTLTIWSLVLLPFLNPVCTSGSSQFTNCWSLAWRILSNTLLAHEMSAIVW